MPFKRNKLYSEQNSGRDHDGAVIICLIEIIMEIIRDVKWTGQSVVQLNPAHIKKNWTDPSYINWIRLNLG